MILKNSAHAMMENSEKREPVVKITTQQTGRIGLSLILVGFQQHKRAGFNDFNSGLF